MLHEETSLSLPDSHVISDQQWLGLDTFAYMQYASKSLNQPFG